jgi:hypothetical protein
MIKSMLATLCGGMLLFGCGSQHEEPSMVRSLTDSEFAGKKFYFGWGAAGWNDPSSMHNEVKYDVFHTHDIFTEQVGGSYLGTKETGSHINRTLITDEWSRIGREMTDEDMYVQYSSGHGYSSGLAVGVSYDEIRDNALAYPAKEVVIFTMACKSGGLVDSFNRASDQWSDWRDQGRNLFVLASSRTWENSSTGPGSDEDEPGGPYGSAGSAFGHALWKSLIGYADGYTDGVKDGYVSLEEILEYSIYKTQRVGGHTPVYTGTYNPYLIMNRVPSADFLASLEGSTEGLSEEEIAAKIQSFDRAMRIQ